MIAQLVGSLLMLGMGAYLAAGTALVAWAHYLLAARQRTGDTLMLLICFGFGLLLMYWGAQAMPFNITMERTTP